MIDRELLRQIDELPLADANAAWRRAVKSAEWNLDVSRDRIIVRSWKASAGEDIELRRARLFAAVCDELPISILSFDALAGRPTTKVIGCAAAIDVAGDYIPDIWSDEGVLTVTMDASASVDETQLEALRESARTFSGNTAPEKTYEAWARAMGEWPKQAEEAKLKDPTLDTAIFGNCTSTVNFRKILSVGLRGIIREAEAHIERCSEEPASPARERKLNFWRSSVLVLEAAIRLAHRYADLAGKMAAEEADPARRTELKAIRERCLTVPENPAGSFAEALQSMAIVGVCKCLEHPTHANPHWGRGDQYLYPYFKKDLDAGAITLPAAARLLAELIGRWGTQTMVESASLKESHQINFCINNMMIGGLNAAGEDQSNELSYLFLHLVGLLKLSSPTVCVRWNRKMPDWLMDKAMRTNLATCGGIPLFENDEKLIASYVKDGIPIEEAAEWCGLGCIYPCLPTRAEHYGAEGIAAFNLAALLHLTLHNGVDICGRQTGLATGDPCDFADFEALYAAFMEQERALVDRIFRLGAIAREVQPAYMRLPFLSSVSVQGCMDDGQDLLIPHPDYSMYGVSDRGIIDAADSLMAIKKLVYEDRRLTMAELIEALDADFEGERGAEIRALCQRQPKYGNDIEEVDRLAGRISADSAAIVHGWDNSPFRSFIVAREGLAWHYFGGLGVGALPNGRKALEPLNDGSLSPMRGADKEGPTAVLHSALTVGFEDSYASALNQKFSASLLRSADGARKLRDYTNAFLKAGGTHIQYNILDTAQLRDAKDHPAEYPDLIVRIGGFSAYFVQLSPDIQDDVIHRSEFAL